MAQAPASCRQKWRFQVDEIDRLEMALRDSLDAQCPRCESSLTVDGPFVAHDTGDRVMGAKCDACGRVMTVRARQSRPVVPSTGNVTRPAPGKRSREVREP